MTNVQINQERMYYGQKHEKGFTCFCIYSTYQHLLACLSVVKFVLCTCNKRKLRKLESCKA